MSQLLRASRLLHNSGTFELTLLVHLIYISRCKAALAKSKIGRGTTAATRESHNFAGETELTIVLQLLFRLAHQLVLFKLFNLSVKALFLVLQDVNLGFCFHVKSTISQNQISHQVLTKLAETLILLTELDLLLWYHQLDALLALSTVVLASARNRSTRLVDRRDVQR